MLQINYQKTIFVILFLCCFFTVNGQHKNFSISATEPTWLQKQAIKDIKPASKDIQDGYYLSIYENQQNLETQEQYIKMARSIVSANGVQNASEISVTFDPSYQKLKFHKIIVWRNNKPINKLTASKFKVLQNEKELTKFIYSGTFDAYIILDDIRNGDKIEYAYTLSGFNPVFGKGFSSHLYFEGGSQFCNLYFNIIFDKNRKINVKNFSRVPPLKVRESNGLKVYEWSQDITKTVNVPDFEPSWYNDFGRVHISEYSSWKQVVDWADKLHGYQISNSPTLLAKIAELKEKAKGDAKEYLNLATRFVQDEIRYMGIEIGEYSHRPNSPEKVLKQRYGDCKDKSLLLVALLKANNIPAYPVFINTYKGVKTSELLPSPSVFDHQVTLAELNGKKVWIDATISNQGGSILENYFPYTANVLVIKSGNDKLELVEEKVNGQLKTESIFHLSDTLSNATSNLTIKSVYSGSYAEFLRDEIERLGTGELSKGYLEYYGKIFTNISAGKDIEIKDDRLANRISLTEYYEIKDIWKNDTTRNRLAFAFYADMVNNDLRELSKGRDIPFALKFPSNIHQTLKIVFPEKWNIDDEKKSYERKAYKFSSVINYVGDTLFLDYKYQNLRGYLNPDETNQYVKDKDAIINDINYEVFWNRDKIVEPISTTSKLSIVVLILTLIIAGFIFHRIYTQRDAYDIEKIRSARSINGWLILVAIGIIITPFVLMFSFVRIGFFESDTWNNFSGYDDITQFLFKLLLCGEIVFNALLFAYSILLIFLFFNRRSSLPKHFIIFRIANATAPIIELILLYLIYEQAHLKFDFAGYMSEFSAIIRTVIISSIWIAYFIKSTRVKETFVFTYPNEVWQKEMAEITLKENFTNFEPNEEQKPTIVVDIPLSKNNDENI